MTEEQAIERLKKLDYLLDDVYSTGLVEDEERNKYQDAIEIVLSMLEEKNKIIDLMSEQLAGLAIFNIDKDETLILSDKEEVKQYFENKAKELLNK